LQSDPTAGIRTQPNQTTLNYLKHS